MTAIDKKYDSMGDFELIDELSALANLPVPAAVEEIRNAEEIHKTNCKVSGMIDVVEEYLS